MLESGGLSRGRPVYTTFLSGLVPLRFSGASIHLEDPHGLATFEVGRLQ
jgi:hypothetical protein